MKTKKVLKLIRPYCSEIRKNKKHYVCYPYGANRTITISSSSSDGNFYKQVYREFRREGVIIKELEKYVHG